MVASLGQANSRLSCCQPYKAKCYPGSAIAQIFRTFGRSFWSPLKAKTELFSGVETTSPVLLFRQCREVSNRIPSIIIFTQFSPRNFSDRGPVSFSVLFRRDTLGPPTLSAATVLIAPAAAGMRSLKPGSKIEVLGEQDLPK